MASVRHLLDAGALSPRRAGSFLRHAADALAQIHARGIYHRDLKPENLMIRTGSLSGEELVLIDFSIAIVKEPDQTIHGLSRAVFEGIYRPARRGARVRSFAAS